MSPDCVRAFFWANRASYTPQDNYKATLMNNQHAQVHRYRRTDQARLGEWEPLGSTWKSAASAGLVAHDVYHHLPSDTGTFAQEVAALGAEWYIDVQPLGSKKAKSTSEGALKSFERNVTDTVFNALDSQEDFPFMLSNGHTVRTNPLSSTEMQFFDSLADKALELLEKSKDPRAAARDFFKERFLQHLVWGFAHASERFPEQETVREAQNKLATSLANLDMREVPYGHELTVTLNGYDAVVAYEDADAEFLASQGVLPAWMMTWCSCANGYPATHVSLHLTERDYVEHLAEHFRRQDEQSLDEHLQCIPEGDSSSLSQVYVRDGTIQEQIRSGVPTLLPVSLMHMSDFTPRGFRVI